METSSNRRKRLDRFSDYLEIWYRSSAPKKKLCGVSFVKFGMGVLYQRLCNVGFMKFGTGVMHQKF